MAWLAKKAHEMGVVRSVALAIAIAWCGVLILGAFVVPAYSSSGSTGSESATLVGENGTAVIAPLMIPPVLVAVVAELLWRRRATSTAGRIAWTITGLLAAFNFLAMLSIGIFVLPVTVCLVIACAASTNQRLDLTDYKAAWKT